MERRVLLPILAAIGIVSLAPATALAAGCPSRVAAGSVRPTETIDRLVGTGKRAFVMFVGGYEARIPDTIGNFEPIRGRLPEYEFGYFGAGGLDGEYNTTGYVGANADALTRAIRTRIRVEDHAEAHVVGHSMGAFTANHAFADACLGAMGEVTSYSAIAGANNGSFAAGGAVLVHDATLGRAAGAMSAIAGGRRLTPAARDLAVLRRAHAPENVRTVNVIAINDPLLTGFDARLDGATNHTIIVTNPEAHGAIAADPRAISYVERNIRGAPTREGIVVTVRGWLDDFGDAVRDRLLGLAQIPIDSAHVALYGTVAFLLVIPGLVALGGDAIHAAADRALAAARWSMDRANDAAQGLSDLGATNQRWGQ